LLVTASDLPDSAVNPVTGYIEVSDAAWTGSDYNARHVVNPGSGQPLQVTVLTTNAADDLGTKLAINASGNTWVTWWRDLATDVVVVRKKTYSNGTWSDEGQISQSDESSRKPVIVHDGTRPWVAFEVTATGGRNIAVVMGSDSPTPWPTRDIVGSTTYSQDLDLTLSSESGKLWITWIDSSSNVAWVQFDYTNQTWSSAATESYTSDSVIAARGRIRTTVLGS
jgi:hypothetical protein